MCSVDRIRFGGGSVVNCIGLKLQCGSSSVKAQKVLQRFQVQTLFTMLFWCSTFDESLSLHCHLVCWVHFQSSSG